MRKYVGLPRNEIKIHRCRVKAPILVMFIFKFFKLRYNFIVLHFLHFFHFSSMFLLRPLFFIFNLLSQWNFVCVFFLCGFTNRTFLCMFLLLVFVQTIFHVRNLRADGDYSHKFQYNVDFNDFSFCLREHFNINIDDNPFLRRIFFFLFPI